LPDVQPAPLYSDITDAPPGGQVLWRTCADGVRIRVGVWPGGRRGTVLIFTGRSEYIEKYGPTIGRLLSGGYSVVICDWRGQGLSDRPHGKPNLGHVERFRDYQLDIAEMLAVAALMGLPKTHFLLAHSMGGSVALRGFAEGLKVSKAVFTAPFWDVKMSAALKLGASLISGLAPSVGMTDRRTPTTPLRSYIENAPYQGNLLTNDEATYRWLQRQVAEHPDLSIGGPSLGWLGAALTEMRHFRAIDPPLPPCLCFLGGNENIVSAKAVYDRMQDWPDGELVGIRRAQHEILMETPDVLTEVWSKIFAFLAG